MQDCGTNGKALAGDPINLAIYGKGGIKCGIDTAFSNECVGSGLILLFSAIDAMANLNRQEGQAESTPQDFKDWVQSYVCMSGEAGVTEEDLWGARNALVHCYGTDSRAVRARTARRVIWAKGERLRESWVVGTQGDGIEVIAVDTLAFKRKVLEGIDSFLIAACADHHRRQMFEGRLQELLLHVADPRILDYVSKR